MLSFEKLRKIPSEYQEQCDLFEWAELNLKKQPCLKYMFATMNGVKLSIGQASKAKKSGNKRGVPDIILPFPSKHYHGLFIELKRSKGGVVSKEQKEFLEYLNSVGYLAVVCRGAKEAIECIVEYLSVQKSL